MWILTQIWIFVAAVVCFVEAGCNRKIPLKRNHVTYITSPGYPGNFTEYVDCYYELYTTSSDPGLLVYVDVLDVTLNCDDDTTQLLVKDGFSLKPRILGQICEGGQTTFESPKQTLFLTFRSRVPRAGRSRGFRLRVRTEPKYCHCYNDRTAVLQATSTPARLTSPFYPYGTEPNVNCQWLLKASQGGRVNATIIHADMKGASNCHNFGLFIYDGKTTYDDKLLASVCDNNLQNFQSSGPFLLVVFTSGSMVYRSGGGVELQYSMIPAADSDRQLIGQTVFYVITALLIFLIIVVTLLAAFKLFILPRRHKKRERMRRATTARLTRVSRSESLSESEGGQQHASCSRASSSMSATSVSNGWSGLSGMSLRRLLSLSLLKQYRQEHRCHSTRRPGTQESGAGEASAFMYNDVRGSGVIIRIPTYAECCDVTSGCVTPSDLPPSYDEAMRQCILAAEAMEDAALGPCVLPLEQREGVVQDPQNEPPFGERSLRPEENQVQSVQRADTITQIQVGNAPEVNQNQRSRGRVTSQSSSGEVRGQSSQEEARRQSLMKDTVEGQEGGIGHSTEGVTGQSSQTEAVC